MSNHILADRRYILLQRLTGSVGQGGQNSRTDGILVQQLLNRLIARRFLPKYGSPVVTDGNVMGSGYTLMLIEHFQEQFGLPKGPIQPDSAAFSKLLELGTSPMIPAGMPDKKALNFDLAVAYIEKFGTQPAINALYSRNGTRVILGLRARTNTTANNGRGVYDDLVVVLWMNSIKERLIQVFEANTEPGAQYDEVLRGKIVDGNQIYPSGSGRIEGEPAYKLFKNNQGRSVRDLGCLPDGTYEFKVSTANLPGNLGDRVLRPTHPLYVQRDGNHNGKFGDEPQKKLELSSDLGNVKDHLAFISTLNSQTTILFHKGGQGNTFSAGCQTLPPEQFDKFWKITTERKQTYHYVLVTVQNYK